MLLSLSKNNPEHQFRIFTISDGDLVGREELAVCLRRDTVDLSFISLATEALDDVMVSHHIRRVTYARLLIDQLLPLNIRRVLYLDCDLIVRGDIGDLWTTNLRGKTIGAVPDVLEYAFRTKLGLPEDAPYFNGGVLLIDLDKWRERKIGSRALAFAREHKERLTWHDQCALNFILHGDWLPLDPIWNHQQLGDGVWFEGIMRFDKMTKAQHDTIRIAHFTGSSKPWHYLNYHPLKSEYLEYRRLTPWPLEKFEDRYPHNIVWRFLHRYLPPLLPLYLKARKIL